MKKRIISVLLVLALLLFTLAGCSKSDSKTDALTKVTLNEVAHSIFYAPMYVAIEEGYFAEEGIELTLVTGFGAIQKVQNNLCLLFAQNQNLGGITFYEDADGNKYAVGADSVPKKLGSGQLISYSDSFIASNDGEAIFISYQVRNAGSSTTYYRILYDNGAEIARFPLRAGVNNYRFTFEAISGHTYTTSVTGGTYNNILSIFVVQQI